MNFSVGGRFIPASSIFSPGMTEPCHCTNTPPLLPSLPPPCLFFLLFALLSFRLLFHPTVLLCVVPSSFSSFLYFCPFVSVLPFLFFHFSYPRLFPACLSFLCLFFPLPLFFLSFFTLALSNFALPSSILHFLPCASLSVLSSPFIFSLVSGNCVLAFWFI